MRRTITFVASILIYTLAASINFAQAQESRGANVNSQSQARDSQFQFTSLLAVVRPHRRAGFALMRAINNTPASGAFRITPAAGPSLPVTGSGTVGRLARWGSGSVIGDSNIFEDKFGKVGIGTAAPTSLLTVQGMIETFGGIKFADGTTQTTAGTRNVLHDATLQGDGTAASPLGVAVPLRLSGSAGQVLTAINLGDGGSGVVGFGGNSDASMGGDGFVGFGGKSSGSKGGDGVRTFGGDSDAGDGGEGVLAFGGSGHGVGSAGGDGVVAFSGNGFDGAAQGFAGEFRGDVDVQGKLTKTMGTFKIDHPLDPENKYLYHSFVESPDMMNIYNGNITTDENGDAAVEMPDYFDSLNKDFRYQLTVIGQFAQAIVANKMKGNRFMIKTNAPNVEVSWMVTGVRQDAYADKNRVQVEVNKSESERGFYLHPEVFNQPEEKSIEWVRHPEMMQRLKQRRAEAEAKIKKQQ